MRATRSLWFSLAVMIGHAGCATPGMGGGPASGSSAPPPRTIQVVGQGRASAAPDSARVSIGVESFAKSLARASEQANADMQRVLSVMAEVGVAPADVRTTRYDVMVERRQDDRGQPLETIGFRVSTGAEVRVRDLAKLGTILDRVVAAGSNQIHGLNLEKADPTEAQARALGDAYQDARAKATALARAANIQVGEIVWVSESAGAGPPITLRAEAFRAAAPVATGELEFTAQVVATFAIQ